MPETEKARAMLSAVNECAAEFIAEGKHDLAARTLAAFKGVPVGSLARLYDIFRR